MSIRASNPASSSSSSSSALCSTFGRESSGTQAGVLASVLRGDSVTLKKPAGTLSLACACVLLVCAYASQGVRFGWAAFGKPEGMDLPGLNRPDSSTAWSSSALRGLRDARGAAVTIPQQATLLKGPRGPRTRGNWQDGTVGQFLQIAAVRWRSVNS
jgi:hypothetical protein